MSEPNATPPFARFEWMLSLRYLRARRREGFISVIAGFSFLGIMLGVATLIIVMAVMNGFRKELLDKILGRTKKTVGEAIDDPSLRREGSQEERKGEAKEDLARDQESAQRHAEEIASLERKTS